jgi:hypothetical protein
VEVVDAKPLDGEALAQGGESHAQELAAYVADFARHRRAIANWNLPDQVMVAYPTTSANLFPTGDDPSALHPCEPQSEQAMPLLYELLSARLQRSRGLRYFAFRAKIRDRVLKVLEARERGEELEFYQVRKLQGE